jgi:hypothetical protein
VPNNKMPSTNEKAVIKIYLNLFKIGMKELKKYGCAV